MIMFYPSIGVYVDFKILLYSVLSFFFYSMFSMTSSIDRFLLQSLLVACSNDYFQNSTPTTTIVDDFCYLTPYVLLRQSPIKSTYNTLHDCHL